MAAFKDTLNRGLNPSVGTQLHNTKKESAHSRNQQSKLPARGHDLV
jgi:hypothetical protein